jgi:type I restriction enzyme S subunit
MIVSVQRLGDISTITLGTSPKGSTYNESGEGLPLLNGPTEFGPHHPACTLYTTDPKCECEPGDLIFCVRGSTTGRMNWADQKYALGRGVCSFRGRSQEDTHFIHYALEVHLRRLLQFAGGATFPNLTKDTLHNFTIPFPNNQGKIVEILSAYDDLIENNRRRIQLLEQAARLLYREWFVYFRFPGHEHVTITDGVPEGWSKSVVADFYFTGSGGTPSRKNPDFYTGKIPWVKTQELTGGFILSTVELITDEAVKCSSAKLFPRHTVLIAMYGATIGQNAILSVPSTTNQACCAVIPKKPGTSYAHAYLFFCHHKTDLVGLGQGAAQNNISQQVIKSFKMVLPRKELMDAFLESVSPLFEQVEILQKSNINLIQARDLLLPRLMNEEVTP